MHCNNYMHSPSSEHCTALAVQTTIDYTAGLQLCIIHPRRQHLGAYLLKCFFLTKVDIHIKLSRLLAFDCAGIEHGSLFCNLTLVLCLTDLHCLLTFSPTSCVCSQRSGSRARRGPTHPVTVMFYTPGAVQLLETMVASPKVKPIFLITD